MLLSNTHPSGESSLEFHLLNGSPHGVCRRGMAGKRGAPNVSVRVTRLAMSSRAHEVQPGLSPVCEVGQDQSRLALDRRLACHSRIQSRAQAQAARAKPCGRSVPQLRPCPSRGAGSGWSRLTNTAPRGPFIQTMRKTILPGMICRSVWMNHPAERLTTPTRPPSTCRSPVRC